MARLFVRGGELSKEADFAALIGAVFNGASSVRSIMVSAFIVGRG